MKLRIDFCSVFFGCLIKVCPSLVCLNIILYISFLLQFGFSHQKAQRWNYLTVKPVHNCTFVVQN